MTITASLTTTQATTYVGQVWYDQMGQPLDETGNAMPAIAATQIAAIDKRLAGIWCFALVKIKVREGNVDRWTTSILFPDGKTRKLIQGEVSVSQRTKGSFLTYQEIQAAIASSKVKLELRRAPDTRFPWHSSAAETKLLNFVNLIELEKWLMANYKPDSILFAFEPGKQVRAPDEEKFFAYLVVVPK